MKYPKFLDKSIILHFATTSFGCSNEPYRSRLINSISFFKSLGFKVKLNDDIFDNFNPSIDEAKNKAHHLNEAFSSQDDSILLSVGGGELMYQLLNYIDFDIIKNNPKWFMGYSDNTNLTFLLPTLCDVASIYAINSPDFGLNEKHQSVYDTLDLLQGKKLSFQSYDKYEYIDIFQKKPLDGLVLNKSTNVKGYPTDNLSFSGRIIGGCLDILLLFLGTKYDNVNNFANKYKDDKIIWFFEACDLDIASIRRALLQIRNAGWFNNTSGIIFGRPLKAYNDNFFGLNKDNVFINILSDLDIPIVYNADIGHVKPSIPIICGSKAFVKTKDNKIFIDMQLI